MRGIREITNQRYLWKDIKKNRAAYIFILPFYIMFGIFSFFPMMYAFWLSFYRWDGLGSPKWVALNNYIHLLKDNLFRIAFLNNVCMLLMATIPGLSLALIGAFILNSKFVKCSPLFKIIYFTPMAASGVVIGLMFTSLYGTQYGLLNSTLLILGIAKPIPWLSDPSWMKISLALLLIWRWLGWNMVIYLAGLKSIPETLYDAARIDGASTPQIFLHITVPLMKPIIMFTMVTSTIGIMQVFEEPFMLTGGYGPGCPLGGNEYSLLTMIIYLYGVSFINYNFGYASAMTYGILAMILIFTITNLKLLRT